MENVNVLILDNYNHGTEVEVFKDSSDILDFLKNYLEDDREATKAYKEIQESDYYENDNNGRPYSFRLAVCPYYDSKRSEV